MTLRPSRKRKNCENSGQIQAEFQTLQSLIPGIADRVEITEVSFAKNQSFFQFLKTNFGFQLEIIDACVDYIESLQTQLDHHWKSGKQVKSLHQSNFVKCGGNLRHNVRMR